MANTWDDFRKYLTGMRAESGGRAENEETSRQNHVQRGTRPQSERERYPDYYERQRERER
jgi:hypothetical protein